MSEQTPVFDAFIKSLSKRPSNSYVNNFYNSVDSTDKYKLNNLINYLQYYENNPPKIILIGEAPGYRGCAASGIPFTSQYTIKSSIFFTRNQMGVVSGEQKENTATVMWGIFDELAEYPLLWNAFPFHPHQKNNKNTNRKPNTDELEEGLYYIKFLMTHFPLSQPAAVGNVAHSSLTSLGLNTVKIRHPSYGGKNKFINDIKTLLKS